MTGGPKSVVPAASDFLLYAAPDGAVKLRVHFEDETAWLTQEALVELFGVKVPAIAKHLSAPLGDHGPDRGRANLCVGRRDQA